MRASYDFMLCDWAYERLSTASGEEALDRAVMENWRFDAIIADHRLGPGLTGVAAVTESQRDLVWRCSPTGKSATPKRFHLVAISAPVARRSGSAFPSPFQLATKGQRRQCHWPGTFFSEQLFAPKPIRLRIVNRHLARHLLPTGQTAPHRTCKLCFDRGFSPDRDPCRPSTRSSRVCRQRAALWSPCRPRE